MLRQTYIRTAPSTDLYHINWLQNALPLPRDGKPLVVGVLGTDMQLLRIPGVPSLLRHAFTGRRVAITPNAEWMMPELKRRFGDLAEICCVPFGIEPRWFEVERNHPYPGRWLCVSRVTRGKIGSLFDWCEPYFSSEQRELHLLGPLQEQMDIPKWIHYHGASNPDDLCRRWFPSAQGLITLSTHAEGRPQVMLEGMAAGLPIIASNLPAHADLILNHETGVLCGERQDLSDAFKLLDDESANRVMGLRAKEWAKSAVGTWEDCANRYATIYKALLAPAP